MADSRKNIGAKPKRQQSAAQLANLTGKGRPKGVPNKLTAAVKDMIVEALDRAGGIDYLVQQAEKNPTSFLTLVGKIIPLQLTGQDGGPVQVSRIEIVAPGAPE